MLRFSSSTLLLLIGYLCGFSQNEITKDELIKYVVNQQHNRVSFQDNNEIFYPQIIETYDSLNMLGVDTIGIYLEEHIGSVFDPDYCIGDEPWFGYVFWEKHDSSKMKKITKYCKSAPLVFPDAVLIRYAINAYPKLSTSYILPVTLGGYINIKGDTILEQSWIDHTTEYTLYCELGEKKVLRSYDEFEISESTSIFYDHNRTSIIKSWRELVTNQLNEYFDRE